jgi:hypothetical protein
MRESKFIYIQPCDIWAYIGKRIISNFIYFFHSKPKNHIRQPFQIIQYNKILYSDSLEFSKNSNKLVPNSTKQYRTVLFFENYVVRTPVPNIVFFKIFNMFDRIKLIKHYIFFNKIKIFSMFDVCLRRCKHQTF